MSRCDYESVFYRVFCVSLLVIAFTFTVILTNVFIDIDNLLNKKEKGPVDNPDVTDHATNGFETTTETQDYYIGLERDDRNYRSKRSLDSEVFVRINNPKTKKYLTSRLAALLEALDDDEPENTTPRTDNNNNIYIKTVKQKNNIEINELPQDNGRQQINADEDMMHLALQNMLQGTIGHLDVPNVLKQLQSLMSSLKNGASKRESKMRESAGSLELFTEATTESKNNLSDEQNPTEGNLIQSNPNNYANGMKVEADFDFNDAAYTNNANEMKKKMSHRRSLGQKPLIRTLIDIKKDETANSKENFEGVIKLTYNGKPIKFRAVDSQESTNIIPTKTTTTTRQPEITTNTINKDVEEFAGVLRDNIKRRPGTNLKTIMLEYLKNLANNSSTKTTIVEKKKIRIKRNIDWSNEKQTEIPQTKEDDELFVEIETHFDKTGTKGEKKRKLVSNLIEKIQNAIRSSPEDKDIKDQKAPIKKRAQNPLGRRTAPDYTMSPPVSQSYRELDPISKSMPLIEPLPLMSDRNGDDWKRQYHEPKFLSSSKSINSAELNLLDVEYKNEDPKYSVIPKREQIPLTLDTSGDNVNSVDVGKLQLLIKDIEGTGFSIGYNQYVDQAPDPESIKLFHGIEHIVSKYHQKHDKPDQLASHDNEYEIYGQEMKKREVRSETSLRTKRLVVNRNNDFKTTLSKMKGKPSVIRAYRKKRSVNLKRIINSNRKIRVSKYINTNAFSRHSYFKPNIRNKRQIDNIKVINKTGQANEDNNMFVVFEGDKYSDNLMVRHRKKPDVFFVDVVKPVSDHSLNHKPLFQPNNKPFSPHEFEIKNLNIYKNTPMFFGNKGKDLLKMHEKRERNKRHTLKIYARDMPQRDSRERSFTEYDEDGADTYGDRTVITQSNGPQISKSDEEEGHVKLGHSRINRIPVIYKNPFIVENNDHDPFENKNPLIYHRDQHEFGLDPIRDEIRKNPLMLKYPHIFVEERTSGERPQHKHIHRSVYSMPESKESDKSSDTEGSFQAPNVQDLVNAIVPSYRNNYKISVKLIPHNSDNDTKQNFKEVHTSINKTFNKDGLLYSSLVNVSEISKVENYTNPCNRHLKSAMPPNIADTMEPVQIPGGFDSILKENKLAEYNKERNDLINTKQEPSEATTEATMQMNLMDIILPSSPRRVIHLSVGEVAKLICDSMKSNHTNIPTATPKTDIAVSTKIATNKLTTTTATITTAMPTETIATTIIQPGKRKTRGNTQTVDPLKIKLLKAISLNEQLTSQILDRIDQNTGVLQTFLSKIASEIAKLPVIANQAIKDNVGHRSITKPPQNEYPNSFKAPLINDTKIAASVYPIPQKPPPNIKPATVLNQNFVQTTPFKNIQRVNGKDIKKIIQENNSEELKQMKYFIDYDPKSSAPQNIVRNEPQRLVLDGLVDDGIHGKNISRIEQIENEIIETAIKVKHLLTEASKKNITHLTQKQKTSISTKPNKIKINNDEYKTTTAIPSNREPKSPDIWKIVLGKFLKQYNNTNSTAVKSTVNHLNTSINDKIDKAKQDVQNIKNGDEIYEIKGILEDKRIQVIGLNRNAQRLGTWPNSKKKREEKSRLKRERSWDPNVTRPPEKVKEPSELTLKWRTFVEDWSNFWAVDWKAVVFAVKREIGKMGSVWKIYPKKDYLVDYWQKKFTVEPEPKAFTILTKAVTMLIRYVYGIQLNYDELLPQTRLNMNATREPSDDEPQAIAELWKN